jgi:polyphosphate kinase
VADLFNLLTGYARPKRFRRVLVSPDHSRRKLLEEVENTIEAHRAGTPSRIVMKMNSLVDRTCIDALYRASSAGVQVDLNVRGICRLRPGVEGLSELIRVVSVVGRFLEHSRIYGFQRNGERDYFIGSADLMPRNLDTRVELLVPVDDAPLKAELEDTLERCFADDTFAWELDADGAWTRREGGRRSIQHELMARALERAAPTQS